MTFFPDGPSYKTTVLTVRETDRAILVHRTNDKKDTWLPKSQCFLYPNEGEEGTLECKHWIAKQEGWI